MSEIIILMGMGESGKTRYAMELIEKGYELIGFDSLGPYGNEENFQNALGRIKNILIKSPNKNFVLDGYVYPFKGKYLGANFEYLKENIKDHKIKTVVIFTDADLIVKRVQKRGSVDKVDKEFVINLYRDIPKYWDLTHADFISCSNDEFIRVIDYAEVMQIICNITTKDVFDFLDRLKNKNYPQNFYDKYYQTIELPFGQKIRGYNVDYEHISWRKIKGLVDYKDKKVADIGCSNGYFCFEIKEEGASKVIGYDRPKPAVDTAKEIAYLKGLDVDFEVLDIEDKDIPEEFDIILFMNISHHLKDPKSAFNKIFSKAKKVIIEMQFTNLQDEILIKKWSCISKDKVIEIAKQNNHTLKKEVSSSRPDRTILLFEK